MPFSVPCAFLTDPWVHLARYLGGFLGALTLCVYALVRRARRAGRAATEPTLGVAPPP